MRPNRLVWNEVIGLDTNILVRYMTRDDRRQSAQAVTLLESLTPASPGFISLVTLVETVWVLNDVYAITRERIVEFVETLLQTDALVVQAADLVWQSVRAFGSSRADFADHLIERIGVAEGCTVSVTFDKIAARDAGMESLPLRRSS